MYLLATHGPMGPILLGVFSTKETLNLGIKAIKNVEPNVNRLYYQEIEVDTFDSTCMQFFTMHPERLVELTVNKDNEINEEFESAFTDFEKQNPNWKDNLTDSTYYELAEWYDEYLGISNSESVSDKSYDFAEYVWNNKKS